MGTDLEILGTRNFPARGADELGERPDEDILVHEANAAVAHEHVDATGMEGVRLVVVVAVHWARACLRRTRLAVVAPAVRPEFVVVIGPAGAAVPAGN